MNKEIKTCQNCKEKFTIEPEDFAFYEKIKVPPPTFCPECRTIRRLVWRNELSLYKRTCNATGHDEEMISMYAPEKNLVVYDQKFWWSDEWDPMDYGREYNWDKPFFEQWKELRDNFPFISVSNANSVNSDYCNVNDSAKDCYLISGSYKNERVMYGNRVTFNKDAADLYLVHRSELCYEDVICSDSYRLLYSLHSTNCTDSYFLYDCRNCTNCFGCTNLRSKNYYIFNQPYSKEDYSKKLAEFDLGSCDAITGFKKQFDDFFGKALHKYANILKSVDVVGDNIENAKNCKFCFDVSKDIENNKFIHWGIQAKDLYDSGPGFGVAELLYETFDTGLQGSHCFFTSVVYASHHVYYSFNCHGSSNLFGCFGLRSKQYCIFNKQYTKEEYEELVSKIIKHMNEMLYVDNKGRTYGFGEFFPFELSPFAYNETVAQDYFPLTKEQALEKGYRWRDREERQYKITMPADKLPDNISSVDESILNEVIGCAHEGKCNDLCTVAFKIIPQELEFYKKLNIPLPRHCFGCRHATRLRKRNPMKLWHRKCMCAGVQSDNDVYKNTTEHSHHGKDHCPNEFETSYSSDRKEIVYCEQCYKTEIV